MVVASEFTLEANNRCVRRLLLQRQNRESKPGHAHHLKTRGFACFGTKLGKVLSGDLLERMGFDVHKTAQIVYCDYADLCLNANRGSFTSMKDGVATSGSIMMPCPWAYQACQYAAVHPKLDLGVHLTLTAEWDAYRWGGLRCKDLAPSLHTPEGFLWASVEEAVERSDPDDIRAEIVAQLARAIAYGFSPTHIDTHMATVFRHPQALEAYVEIAVEAGLPSVLVDNPVIVAAFDVAADLVLPVISRMLQQHRLCVLDSVIGGAFEEDYDVQRARYRAQIEGLGSELHQIVVHPMDVTEDGGHIARTWCGRENDYRFCLDPNTRALLQDLGIHLIGWWSVQQALSDALAPVK